MKYVVETERITYTGKEIEPLWAFKRYGIQEDSIIAFRGPMEVDLSQMKDLADIKQLEPIYADDAVNFIVEHFDYPDLRTTYLRQRLLISVIKEILEGMTGQFIIRKGDDLYYLGKLSVSIATCGITSGKIHVGINVTLSGIPEDVEASSLETLGITNDSQIREFMELVCIRYIHEIEKIEKDIRKTMTI